MKRIQIPIFLRQKKTRNVGLLFCTMLVLVVCLFLYSGKLFPKGNRTTTTIQSADDLAAQVQEKAQTLYTDDDINALATSELRAPRNSTSTAQLPKSKAIKTLWEKGQFEILEEYAKKRLARNNDDFPALLILLEHQMNFGQQKEIFETILRIIDLSPTVSFPHARDYRTVMMLGFSEMASPKIRTEIKPVPPEKLFCGWGAHFSHMLPLGYLEDLEKGGIL